MAASGVGSDIFFALSLFTICGLVLLLLRYYLPLRTTPAYLLVPVFLSLALPASIILLVPIDLASSAGTDTGGSRGIWLPHGFMLVAWRISYWLTFALTWVILPLLGEYCDAGYREPRDRFIYSLRSNGQYHLFVLGSGVLGAVYFFVQSGFRLQSLKALVMALAYAWGLILAVYLMGHGLVALPRRLWRKASISGRLRRLQSKAPKIHDKLTDAMEELEQYERQVLQLRQRKTGSARSFQDWIDDLAESSALPESRYMAPDSRPSGSSVPPVITERYLADLARKLKRARHAKARFSDEWTRLVTEAVNTQAILDSAASKKIELQPQPHGSSLWSILQLPHASILTPYTRYLWHTGVIPSFYYALSVVLGLCSVSIIWSEVVKSLDPKLSLVGLTVIHHPRSDRGQIGFAGQCIAAGWILYMCAAALFSVTEVKIWGNRALVRRQTYSESATWYACQVAKLTVPLAYDFITALPPNIYRATTFYSFLGRLINLTPLGSGFSSYFPIFVLVPVTAATFNLYAKVRTVFGFGGVIDDNEYGEECATWREGRALIDREVHDGAGSVVGLTRREAGEGRAMGRADQPWERRNERERVWGRREERERRPAREERRRLISTADDSEDDLASAGQESWFGGLSHRVKNTFETFERPRWMGGGESTRSTGSRRAGGSSSGIRRIRTDSDGSDWTEGLTRWFGGRRDGRVRL